MGERVLLIDDDAAFADMTMSALRAAGYEAGCASNGIEGLSKVMEWRPNLVILDVMMPQLDGWETCERIRSVSNVPIVMLTGVAGPANELKGLNLGIDLYMTKPLSFPLLIARVTALLRRSQSSRTDARGERISVGDLEIDLAGQVATKSGRPLDLSRTELRLLIGLAATPGRVISNRDLIRQVWGDNEVGDQEQYLKLYIYYLRHKIEDDPAKPRYILNRRGIGYLLAHPDAFTSRADPSREN